LNKVKLMSSSNKNVRGLAWLHENTYGCQSKALSSDFASLSALHSKFLEEGVLSYAIEQFKRFDRHSKQTALVVGLALYDADFKIESGKKKHVAIIGVSEKGAFQTNMNYYQDYIASGRKMGRGSLFVYTLPTSPLAETAIHFGLEGPLIHLSMFSKNEKMIELQENMFLEDLNIEGVLVIQSDENKISCSLRTR
jgi:hypothetical protein